MDKKNLLLIFIILSLFATTTVYAADSTNYQQQLLDNQNKLEYIKSQIIKNQYLIEQINNQASSVMLEIQQIDTLIQIAQSEIAEIEERIRNTEDKIQLIQNKRSITKNKLEQLETSFDEITKGLTDNNQDYWTWALATNSPTSLNLRMQNLSWIYSIYNMAIEENAKNEIEMKAQEGALLIESNNLQNDKQILLQKQNFIEQQLNYKVAVLNQLNEQKNQAEAYEDQLEDVSQQIASVIKTLQSYGYTGSGNIKKGKGVMSWPAENGKGRRSSGYGKRIHPIYKVEKMHNGLDIGGLSKGEPVLASADGIVIHAGWINGYGNTVIIDHGNKISTLYAHNSKLVVKVGQEVKRGEKIAEVGSTGLSTGPHIHFEVRVDGKPVDPEEWL